MSCFCKLSFALLASLVWVAGCGSGVDVAKHVEAKNKSNLQKVANSLFLFQARTGKACKSEEELCNFIATNSRIEENLELMKIDKSSFPDYLIGQRDGEPFYVRYGATIPSSGPGVPLVFESVGVDGGRQVGWSDARVTELSDKKEYEKLKSGKKKVKFVDVAAEGARAAAQAAKTRE